MSKFNTVITMGTIRPMVIIIVIQAAMVLSLLAVLNCESVLNLVSLATIPHITMAAPTTDPATRAETAIHPIQVCFAGNA